MTPRLEAPRIWVVRASKARVAAVFRRGPSDKILVLKWSLATDVVEPGQWLSGRIYERRSHLSPSGEFLVYFAADHHPPHRSWTAVSRLPWLTALAFWPKGDCWGGGGLFTDDDRLLLNHSGDLTAEPGRGPPRELKVAPFGTHAGWGEDSPIGDAILAEAGWRAGASAPGGSPACWEKTSRKGPVLRTTVCGIGTRRGRRGWYDLAHQVLDAEGREILAAVDFDWADWDDQGDLLFAEDGRLMRLDRRRLAEGPSAAVCVADLDRFTYDPRPSPARARRW